MQVKKFKATHWLVCHLINKGTTYTQITDMTGIDRSQASKIFKEYDDQYLANPEGIGIIGGMEKFYPNKNKK